jgi:replicative DNA helicase
MGERGPSDRETDAATHAARRGEFFEKALSGKSGILTGQQWLDLAFGGMIEGRLYVISGQPGCGKSSLCRNIADYAARSGNRVDFLTLEIMAQEVSAAICCARAGVSMLSLDAGRSRADLAKYNEAAKSFAGVPLFIQGGLYTPSKMFSWARRAVAKGSRLIVIDYIQRLGSDDPKANEEHRVACASEMALNIALKFNVPVLAVSSESNQGNLRHSGQITYDAAGWVRLKMADDKKTVMATFEKHRHGSAPGVTNLVFDQHGILTEVADY